MIIAIAVQKGGTGKTTTAAILAQAAAHKGLRPLAIDLDPQGNLSIALGARMDTGNSYNMLQGAPSADQIQRTGQGIEAIAASWNLSTITSGPGSARRLQEALDPIRGVYDMIIIDTPPTAGELQYNALQAADRLIIPLQADTYNVQSLYQITDTARQIMQSNAALQIAGIILTQYDGRTTIARQMQRAIINTAGAAGVPYLGTIRAAVAVKEAAALRKSLYEYAPRSKPAADYMDVFNYLTNYKYLTV